MQEMEHEWKDYIEPEHVETVWQKDKLRVYEELKTIYMMENIPSWYAKQYWEQTLTSVWRRGYDWTFLWMRSKRPRSENLDVKTIVECCKEHLKDCLSKSYEFCDLKSPGPIRGYVLGLDLAAGCCIACYKKISGSDSDKFCARCYRQKLNNWRPI
jgi:hypothetical protein